MSSDNSQTKPTNIDELLKQMLLENPALMADLQKSVPASKEPQGSSVKTPRERKAPSADYFLQIYSGCETCHAITVTSYNMKWDSINGCFRPKIFCCKDNVSNQTQIQTQSTTARNCPSCPSELNKMEKHELVSLFIQLTEPEAGINRLFQLKKKLRGFGR